LPASGRRFTHSRKRRLGVTTRAMRLSSSTGFGRPLERGGNADYTRLGAVQNVGSRWRAIVAGTAYSIALTHISVDIFVGTSLESAGQWNDDATIEAATAWRMGC
jgi:hypothetical protein